MDRRRKAGIEPQQAHRAALRRHRARDGPAHVERVDHGELFEVPVDEVGQLEQQRLALERLELAPRAFEGPARGSDREVDIGGAGLGDLRELFACGGIGRLEGLAGGGRDSFAVD